jgi:NAD+ kinase
MEATALKRVAILAHPQVSKTEDLPAAIRAFLTQRRIDAQVILLSNEDDDTRWQDEGIDLMIAVGGDGTMLRAGAMAAPSNIPVIGINLGRLGFLVEVGRDEWQTALERVMAGDFWLEARMRLRAELHRDEKLVGSWEALNECVVGRGEVTRPVRVTAEVDERILASYVADALICATATGSTAYALAAGGPILPPELRNLLLVPVAPHMSLDRAIVLPEGSRVRIDVEVDREASLGMDGQKSIPLRGGDQIRVQAAEHDVRFVRLEDRGYFFRNLTFHMNSFPHQGDRNG